jgi:hypothetical protein
MLWFGKELGIRREKFLLEIWLTPKFFLAKTSFNEISPLSSSFCKNRKCTFGKSLSKNFVLTQGPLPEIRRYKKITEGFTWEKAGGWGVDQVILIPKLTERL